MKKYIFIIIAVMVLLAIPTTVFAYGNNFNFRTMFNTNETSRNYMMNGFDCSNIEDHDKFLAEQKLIIEEQLANGEITEEEAKQYLEDLEYMIRMHQRYQTDDNTTRRGCH